MKFPNMFASLWGYFLAVITLSPKYQKLCCGIIILQNYREVPKYVCLVVRVLFGTKSGSRVLHHGISLTGSRLAFLLAFFKKIEWAASKWAGNTKKILLGSSLMYWAGQQLNGQQTCIFRVGRPKNPTRVNR